MSSFIGRPPFSPTFPDISPSDASDFQQQLSTLPPPIVKPAPSTSDDSAEKGITAKLQHYIEDSTFHRLLVAATRSESLNDDIISDSNDARLASNKRRKIRIPGVQVIQQLSCASLHYLELFESSCSTSPQSNPSSDLTDGEQKLLSSPTFSRFIALLFWPLKHSATYERFIELQKSFADLTDPIPLFDVSSATSDQQSLCLQLLSSCLSTSLSLLRLFIRLDGHWGAALLAELDISRRTLAVLSQDSILFRGSLGSLDEIKSLFNLAPRSANKVKVRLSHLQFITMAHLILQTHPFCCVFHIILQVAALHILSTCSTRRLGLEALIAVRPPAVPTDSQHENMKQDNQTDSVDSVPQTTSSPNHSSIPPPSSPLSDSRHGDADHQTIKDDDTAMSSNILSRSSTTTRIKPDPLKESHSIYESLITSSLEERVTFARLASQYNHLSCSNIIIYTTAYSQTYSHTDSIWDIRHHSQSFTSPLLDNLILQTEILPLQSTLSNTSPINSSSR